MRAILQYVQKVIASGKDGTICITIETGEVATLTVKDRSIVAATLDDSTGKAALEAIKLAVITHMEFWNEITRKQDIQRMVTTQSETNALAPVPEDELYPEGAPIAMEPGPDLADANEAMNATSSDADRGPRDTSESIPIEPELSTQHIRLLSEIMTDYIGPAAGIVVDSVVESSGDMDEIIRKLAEELFDDKERSEFSNKAYFLLSQI